MPYFPFALCLVSAGFASRTPLLVGNTGARNGALPAGGEDAVVHAGEQIVGKDHSEGVGRRGRMAQEVRHTVRTSTIRSIVLEPRDLLALLHEMPHASDTDLRKPCCSSTYNGAMALPLVLRPGARACSRTHAHG